ncbi:hypothetical protein OIU84_029160 [Salix udensis]|uniref:O-acyltransferase WSD1 C-terminal domain-containing protein n=1 Tax=Salix udensis TaxID=889485 RepID=A0AAD6KAT6_9ROSI|nr:hypothetical protein OIU84_029160 [Salix udensis]
MELTITQPDDWHLHLRDGEVLQAVVPHSASSFGRAIVMPNLKPPITSTAAAVASSFTLNDVITGTVFLGTRLYMETLSPGSRSANSSSLVLLNTWVFTGYKSIEEMVKPNAELPWGNHFAFLNIPLPNKFRGAQGASKYIHGTMMNTIMGITNVMQPIEQMALVSHPVKGLYFVMTGAPQSLMVGVISYAGKLRVALMVEKDFIDP